MEHGAVEEAAGAVAEDAAAASRPSKRGKAKRRSYSEDQRSQASPFLRSCMMLADCNSNLAGGSKKWKEIHEQTMKEAPDEDMRYKISEVSKVFKANTVGCHAVAMDVFIEEYLEEHPSERAVCSGQGIVQERPKKKPRAAPAGSSDQRHVATKPDHIEDPRPNAAVEAVSSSGASASRPVVVAVPSSGTSASRPVSVAVPSSGASASRPAEAVAALFSGASASRPAVAAVPSSDASASRPAEVVDASSSSASTSRPAIVLPVASSGASASRPAAVVAIASASRRGGIRQYFGGRGTSRVEDPAPSRHGASSSSSGRPRPAHDPASSSRDAPSSDVPRNPDPENHYKVLGISPNSSGKEVRDAFLVRVLESHPDKGGRAADFNAVKQAYHILSDSEKRAAYDGRPEAEAPAACDPLHDKVKTVVATLMVSPPAIRPSLVQSMSRESVAAASELFEEVCAAYSRTKAKDRRNSIVVHSSSNNNEEVEESTQTTGLYRMRTGEWNVKVGWGNFFVKAERVKSLEKASRVLTACIHGRELAKARRKAFFKSLADNRCPITGRAAYGVEECPQLLHSELLAMLCMEPFPLQFSSDLSSAKPRIMSPFTPSYDLSIEFRVLIRKVQEKYKECLFREELDKNARESMRLRAVQDRANRNSEDLELLDLLNKELSSRGSRREGDDAAGAAGGIVAQQGQEVPALQDTVAAAVASVASELSAAHRSAMDDFSAAMRRENAELFEQCREAIRDREEKRLREEASSLREEALQKDLNEAQTKQEELRRKVDEKQSELEETLKKQLAKHEEEERARGQAAEPNTPDALQEELAAVTQQRDEVTRQRDELQEEIVRLQHQRANDRSEADLRVQLSRATPSFSKQATSKSAAEGLKQRQIINLQEAAKAAVSKVLPARERAFRLARGLTV